MLKYSLIFLVLAVVCGVLGSAHSSFVAVSFAKLFFAIFAAFVLFAVCFAKSGPKSRSTR